jgi:UDP-N-acetylglucosamine 2-epimerase (non-hydrolysing)
MLDQVLDLFDICPQYDLDIMKPGQDLCDITCNVLLGLRSVLQKERPDLVLVHGDTTTAMAASLATFYQQIPVGHIEAGLRTHNKYAPFPEEVNRKVTGAIADLHFAPTETAKINLLREGVSEKVIHVTGNTVIDALLLTVDKIERGGLAEKIVKDLTRRFPALKSVLTNPTTNRRLILVTGHRRENFGIAFENICHALTQLAVSHRDVDIIYPVHLNPNVQEPVQRILGQGPSNIFLIEPLDYLPFVYLMSRAYLIITDSGGVQEEAPSLGKPVLVLRESTERPEAVTAGTVKLVGSDLEKIVYEASSLLENPQLYAEMARALNPYGDGRAAERIGQILLT